MRIGLSYDLKQDIEAGHNAPEDALEEYDSLTVVNALAGVLKANGHTAVKLGGGRQFMQRILRSQVDFVFNIAEGRGNHRSREAQIPSILEMLDIPYSGSDPQTLAVTLDKPLTKQLVQSAGVKTPPWTVINTVSELNRLQAKDIPLPAFVKPAYEGSSKGIRLNSHAKTVASARSIARKIITDYHQPALIEGYIQGEEITVGIIGNLPPRIVGIMHVAPRRNPQNFIYSLEVKRDWTNLVDYHCPAQFDQKIMRRISAASLKAYSVLGCRDFARMDFRLGNDGVPYFLEVNPLPGLNPESGDLPIMSYKMGLTYKQLVTSILNASTARYGLCR